MHTKKPKTASKGSTTSSRRHTQAGVTLSTYRPVIKRTDIESALQQLSDRLAVGSVEYRCKVTSVSENRERVVRYHQKERFWSFVLLRKTGPKHLCKFGVDDPRQGKSLRITIQFNMAKSGRGIRHAGCLIQDPNGELWLGHSGRVGGGIRGLGIRSLKRHHDTSGKGTLVRWPGASKLRWIILVCKLDDVEAVQRIGRFVRDVHAIKRSIKQGQNPKPVRRS